ncbi:MAG: imidazole glycerol phosphate synthase subunit HisH [Sphingobacteriaceae bacterium]|nr:imidazole glycerol phosphate synthase subunit HisH [Sphingobacteriaceae bacterium]
MVAIIDYGMGNVASVQKALNFLKIESAITSDPELIEKSDVIILPGVGSFLQGMKNLKSKGLDVLLTDQVLNKKKKFLGICLGMQLLAEAGTEPNDNPGLGWIKGKVKKIENIPFRIPHMGWNNINVKIDKYYSQINEKDFYFIHSYHFVPSNSEVIAATTNYGIEIVASIQQDNIFATQFHPEKSQEAGLTLLRNFFNNA